MHRMRETLFNVMFLWVGVVITWATLDNTPRSDWASAAVMVGLLSTAGVILVGVVDVVIRRRLARRVD